VDRTVDKIARWVRWVKGNQNGNGGGNSQGENGNGAELQLWTVSDGHGFQVVRFTDNFKKNNQDLFEDSGD
jgi:hypothetical protein